MSKNTNEAQSPYGPGFIAACIVVGAVLLCGAVLLISNLTSAGGAAAQAQTGVDAGTAAGGGAAGGAAVGTGTAAETGSPATPVNPTGPTGSTGSTGSRRPGGGAGCGLPGGDQAVPTKAPVVDGWDVSRRVVVPRSATYGPTRTDSDGFRRCFAHSPTGAVYAAYSALAALADADKQVATARKLMLPGPDTEALIREVQEDPSNSGYAAPQPGGYRVVDAGPDRVTVMLAVPVETAYMSLTLTLVWHDDDWRLQPPARGEAVGAPFSQHKDLSDFVPWSGV
ncbi:hypothetical protein AB0E69_11955 [Kribbella sp. NPDC026611]|uniref:hypothetical protein n=1 Tax=Kribbella sp. NPDC026611 TaxID=3154911 RepID=UPI0033C5D7AB